MGWGLGILPLIPYHKVPGMLFLGKCCVTTIQCGLRGFAVGLAALQRTEMFRYRYR